MGKKMNQTKNVKKKDIRDKIVTKVNKEFDKSVFSTKDGGFKPYVCIICDRFLHAHTLRKVKKEKLESKKDLLFPKHDVPAEVSSYYTYDGEGSNNVIKSMLLSPRGIYIEKKDEFICCEKCHYSFVRKNTLPTFAICNGFEIGQEPQILRELTDVELAFISPVRRHAHLLTFFGGHRGIKGFHSLIKTNIVKTDMVLNQLDMIEGFPDKIYIVLSGDMTDMQRQQVLDKCSIRRHKCKEALDWLRHNNKLYKLENYSLSDLPEPVILEQQKTIQSRDSNIECKEEITVVFPDGTLDLSNGGYENKEEFKRVVDAFNSNKVTAEILLPDSKYVRDFDGNNFAMAFPRHFPYGIGGPNDRRLLSKGQTGIVDKKEYVKYITNLSHVHFSEPLFILVAFNLYCRQKIVDRAFWKVNQSNENSISNLVPDDILKAINVRNGSHYSTKSTEGTKFLDLVNVISQCIPHSNEAAKRARKDLFSLQSRYGNPDVFFTVSPPDDNSFIIIIYGGFNYDYSTPIEEMTIDQLKEVSTYRRKLAFDYPGLSALNFQRIYHIVQKHILGIDSHEGGIFGRVKASFATIEEQSRKALHTHILVWLYNPNWDRNALCDPEANEEEKRTSSINLCDFVDNNISSNKLLGSNGKIRHTCLKAKRHGQPQSVSKEQLRVLRHQKGCRTINFGVAYCPYCKRQWTSQELVMSHVFTEKKSKHVTTEVLDSGILGRSQVESKAVLKTISQKVQNCSKKDLISKTDLLHKPYCSPEDTSRSSVSQGSSYLGDTVDKIGQSVISEMILRSKIPGAPCVEEKAVNAVYNVHASSHVKTCFKNDGLECRYKFPKLSSKRTRINFEEGEIEWFHCTGRPCKRRIIEVIPAREELDSCVNNYVPVISRTKIACNSNARYIVNGVEAFYVTKYVSKDTQEEDLHLYGPAIDMVQKRFLQKKFATNTFSESLSRLITITFCHNRKNVISATMAKFLIDNDKRFFSTDTIEYLPLGPLKEFLLNRDLMLDMLKTKSDDGKNIFFLTNSVLDYLYRPEELEDTPIYDFVMFYYVTSKSSQNDDDDEEMCLRFKKDHPARSIRFVRERKMNVTVGLNNWKFADSAYFNGDITDENVPINSAMEDFAFTVLLTFCPFQMIDDLKHQNSFVLKLRRKWTSITSDYGDLLQNMQDIRNVCRGIKHSKIQDDLERCTIPYKATSNEKSDDSDDDVSLDEVCESYMHDIFGMEELDLNDCPKKSASTEDQDIRNLCLQHLLDKGHNRCGYGNIVNQQLVDNNIDLVVHAVDNQSEHKKKRKGPKKGNLGKQRVNLYDLYRVLVTSVERIVDDNINRIVYPEIQRENDPVSRTIPFSKMHDSEHVVTNGTLHSFIQWAKKSSLDKKQTQAFLIIMSHFILSYMEDAESSKEYFRDLYENDVANTDMVGPQYRPPYISVISKFRTEKNHLLRIVCGRKKLRMFLNGPGGSGKSAVLKQVLVYAKRFCYLLGEEFTSKTIMMTASTGVASVLINGNTVHTSLNLNNKNPTDDEKIAFQHTRLLIIDEISMISHNTLINIDEKLRSLREISDYYGDVNTVFVGDFRQLDPVGDSPIYAHLDSHQWVEGINTYIELDGQYRFSDDPEWGNILNRFRKGVPNLQDFYEINQRVVRQNGTTHNGDALPTDIKYCCPKNMDRDAINTAIFNKTLKSDPKNCVVILSDNLVVKQGGKKGGSSSLTVQDPYVYYSSVGENDCKFPKGRTTRMDPALKLYKNCPLMLTENHDVENNQANGTKLELQQILLKKDAKEIRLCIDGTHVSAYLASSVIEARVSIPERNNIELVLHPKDFHFKASLPGPLSFNGKTFQVPMKATQLPFIRNDASTGHKLQGCTVDNLFVTEFDYGKKNWPYVVLSRVKTLKGLFLAQPLDPAKNYRIDENLQVLLAHFEQTKVIPDKIFRTEYKATQNDWEW